eukprot:111101-Prorocentrum_minimum.AAC.1
MGWLASVLTCSGALSAGTCRNPPAKNPAEEKTLSTSALSSASAAVLYGPPSSSFKAFARSSRGGSISGRQGAPRALTQD